MQAAPRLILVTPEIGADDFAGDLAAALDGALEGAGIAAVILRFAATDERTRLARAKKLVGTAQAAGAAALLQGADDLVGRAGADGAHAVGDVERLSETVRRFQPEKMVGAGGLLSRHDCMLAGEAGVDYLLFGDGEPLGDEASLPALLDRVSWWSEIFTSPCAALAPTQESVSALARAGADFVALGGLVWSAPEGPRLAVRRAADALDEVAA